MSGTFARLLGTMLSAFKVGKATLDASGLTTARTHTLPNADGTLALLSQCATAAQGAEADSAVQPNTAPTFTGVTIASTTEDTGGVDIVSTTGSEAHFDIINNSARVYGKYHGGAIVTPIRLFLDTGNVSVPADFAAGGAISGSNLSGTNTGDQDLSGLMPKTGGAFSDGVSFGSNLAASAADLSKHLALYSTTYGFSVTSSALNHVASAVGSNFFYSGATCNASIGANGLSVKNANSTTLTRQPRVFVQSADPGAAAADGDLWFW